MLYKVEHPKVLQQANLLENYILTKTEVSFTDILFMYVMNDRYTSFTYFILNSVILTSPCTTYWNGKAGRGSGKT
jgi:hypothetical protein